MALAPTDSTIQTPQLDLRLPAMGTCKNALPWSTQLVLGLLSPTLECPLIPKLCMDALSLFGPQSGVTPPGAFSAKHSLENGQI